MLSYTNRRNLYGKFTNDTSSTNLSHGDTLMNEAEKRIMNKGSWAFIQRTTPQSTVASQQFYNLPFNYRKLIGNPTITVGSNKYIPQETPTREAWDFLNSTSQTSDIPSFFFIFNNQIGFYPTPSSSGNTITLPYEIQQKDLNIADYTTGSIVSITNSTTTVIGTGTTWTSIMTGRFIRITLDDSTTSGDNEWYEISSVTNATTLELSKAYNGATIATATQSYTIGQFSVIPDGYDMLPVYKATEQYYLENIEAGKSDRFKLLYDELFKDLVSDRGSKTSSLVINRPREGFINTNLTPNSIG